MLHNNWCDGPFDQLSGNYIKSGKVHIKEFIEEYYLGRKGKIDKFGNIMDEIGVCVPIAPYSVYFLDDELDFIESCKRSESNSEFYKCITLQTYRIPERYERLCLKYNTLSLDN